MREGHSWLLFGSKLVTEVSELIRFFLGLLNFLSFLYFDSSFFILQFVSEFPFILFFNSLEHLFL
jgi:hypothetical protein